MMRSFFGLGRLALTALLVFTLLLTAVGVVQNGAPIRPTLKLQLGHRGEITFLAIRADSRIAATAGKDDTVRLWDIASGREIRTLMRDTDAGINGLAFGGGPAMPLAIQHKRSISLWNTTNGTLIRNIPVEMSFSMPSISLPQRITAPRRMAISPDGRYLVTISGSWVEGATKLNLWDLSTGKSVATLPGGEQIWQAPTFRPDSKRVAVATDDGFFVLEVPSGKVARRVTLETDEGALQGVIKDLAYTRNGDSVVVQRSLNNELSLYDPAQGKRIKALTLPMGMFGVGALSIALRPGTDLLTVSNDSGGITVWDLASAAPVAVIPNVHSDFIVFTPDGSGLLTVGKTVRVWDANTYQPLRELRGGTVPMGAFVLAPDARSFYYSSEAGGVFRWDLTTGETAPFAPGIRFPTTLVLAKKILLVGEADGKVTLFDRDYATPLRTLGKPLGQMINCAAFSPTGNLVAVGTNPIGSIDKWLKDIPSDDDSGDDTGKKPKGKPGNTPPAENKPKKKPDPGLCIVYDTTTGQERFRFPYPEHAIGAVSFSPDGKRLVVGTASVDVYDLATGKKLGSYQPADDATSATALSTDVTALTFNRTGNRLFIRHPAGVEVWELATETRKDVFPIGLEDSSAATAMGAILAGLPLYDVAVSPDGTLIAANTGSTAVVYELATHRLRCRLTGHEGDILRVAFHTDNNILYTAGTDGTVRLWDIKTSQPRLILAQVENGNGILATPTGEYMANRAGLRAVAFRAGDHAYPVEQFDLRYNRPDIILSRLPFGDASLLEIYRQATEKRLALNGGAPDPQAVAGTPPILTLNPPPVAVAASELSLTLSAQGSNLASLRLTINGVPVPFTAEPGGDASVQNGLALPTGASAWQGKIRVTLTPGQNRIEARVRDAAGQDSLRQTCRVTCSPPNTQTPELYVIATGISHYQESRWNLDFARKDAEEMKSLFEAAHAFGKVHTLLLTDEGVTRSAVEAQVKTFLATARPEDTVVAFFAGHGLRRGGAFYFATYDMDFNDPAKNGLSFAQIEDLLSGCAARQRALLIDACQAGEIDPLAGATGTRPTPGQAGNAPGSAPDGLRVKSFRGVAGDQEVDNSGDGTGRRSFALMQQFFADVREQGIVVIAASGGAEYAFERDGNGVFTAAMKEALAERKAFAPGATGVTISALRRYVSERVWSRTDGRQMPMARGEPLESDWIIYGDQVPEVAAAPRPPANWQRTPLSTDFAVTFPPGKIESSKDEKPVPSGGSQTAYNASIVQAGASYFALEEHFDPLAWAAYLKTLPPGASDQERVLNATAHALIPPEGTTVEAITDITLGSMIGREYQVDILRPGEIRRIVLIRIYVGKGYRIALTTIRAVRIDETEKEPAILREMHLFTSSLRPTL